MSEQDYDLDEAIADAIEAGDVAKLEELSQLETDFPVAKGEDFVDQEWLHYSLDFAHANVVEWLLSKGRLLYPRNDEGWTVLDLAIQRPSPDRPAIVKLLLDAGADVNAHGMTDYTPAHHAAMENDIATLKVLIEAGADLSIRTRIDYYATPLEEAIAMGWEESTISFLKQCTP